MIENERSELGYAHLFKREFKHDGKDYDRLELIIDKGILSPHEAKIQKIPFKVNFPLHVNGIPPEAYNKLVFLFPIRKLPYKPHWGTAIVIDSKQPVLTPQEKANEFGNWIQMSQIFGEVYAEKVVDPKMFREIIIPNSDEDLLERTRLLVPPHLMITVRGKNQ